MVLARLSLLCILLGAAYPFTHEGTATFHHPSIIVGTVTFTKNTTNSYVNVKVTSSVALATTSYMLKVYDFTADYGKKDACAASLIGGVWNPTNKGTTTAGCTTSAPANCVQGALDTMFGNISTMNQNSFTYTPTAEVVGRTVAIVDSDGDIMACAPIIMDGATTFLRSKLTEKNNVNGEVNMQKTSGNIVSNTKLARDGGNAINQLRVNNNPRSDGKQGTCSSYTSFTTLHNWGTALWTNKQDVSVSSRTSVPTNLILRQTWASGFDRLYGDRTCAPIYQIKERSASATFDQNGLSGSVTFTQQSPYHPVVIKRAFAFKTASYINTASISHYAVPLYSNAEMTKDEICGADWTPGTTSGTTLETAALDGTDFSTTGFTLYGVNSVIGRALIFKTINTTFCADIRNDAMVKRLVADFHGNLGGDLTLEQDQSDPNSDTTIYNGLYSAGGYTNDVRMILNNNKANEANLNANRCPSNSVFYPDAVSASSSDLSTDTACTNPDYAYNCKQGVTYSRIGNLAIRTITGKVKLVRIMTDPYMALSGAYAIPTGIKLTYVNSVNGSTATSNLDCANLKEIPNIYAKAVISADAKSVYSAAVDIKFVQYAQKNDMAVEMAFGDVLTLTKSLTVRENPIPNTESGYPYLTCSAELLGGILNPNKGRLAKVVGWSDFEYAAGALSAKYSVFASSNSRNLNKNIVSDGLSFYNKKSTPLYRSVRMGYGEEDEDYVCANICPVAANNSFTESKLYAVFSGMESEVSGQITMKQLSYSSSSTGNYLFPTNVQSYLTHANHSNWITDTHRVYITTFTSCSEITDSTINLETDLFNPYAQSAQYVHNVQYPHFSQVGDITSKAGTFASFGKRTFANVDNIPLSGTFSVAGKAIVVSSSTNEKYLGCTIIQSTLVNSGVTMSVSAVVLVVTALFNLF